MKTDKVVKWLDDLILYRGSRPKLTAVLCCDSHELGAAEGALPPTTLPPPTYAHTYTLAVATLTLTMFGTAPNRKYQMIVQRVIIKLLYKNIACFSYESLIHADFCGRNLLQLNVSRILRQRWFSNGVDNICMSQFIRYSFEWIAFYTT